MKKIISVLSATAIVVSLIVQYTSVSATGLFGEHIDGIQRYDFNTFDVSTDLSDFVTSNEANPAKIIMNGSEKVLSLQVEDTSKDKGTSKWDGEASSYTRTLTLDKTVDFSEGPVTIQFTMKRGKSRTTVKLLGENKDGNAKESNLVYNYGYGDGIRFASGNTSSRITYEDARDYYYDYKFVIGDVLESDATQRAIEVYYRQNGETTWINAQEGQSTAYTFASADMTVVKGFKIVTSTGYAALYNNVKNGYSSSSASNNKVIECYPGDIYNIDFKSIEISVPVLKLDRHNLGDGENPIFSNSKIELYFNYEVARSSLQNAIKVYKGATELNSEDGVTISVDTQDNTKVIVDLGGVPKVGFDYQIKINDQLNKDSSGNVVEGYFQTLDGYSKTLFFHSEQRTDLAIVSTNPEDDAEVQAKEAIITLNNPADLDSTKNNIVVRENDTVLSLDFDYKITLDENDEKIIKISLIKEPIAHATYSITVKKTLNYGVDGYVSFDIENGQDHTFSYKYEQRKDLAITSTSPENGAEVQAKEAIITLNNPADLDSAKNNIVVKENDTVLSLDVDYKITLDENDERIIKISLIKEPTVHATYSITVKKILNYGVDGYVCFDVENSQDQTFVYTYIKNKGKTDISVSYADKTETEAKNLFENSENVRVDENDGAIYWGVVCDDDISKFGSGTTITNIMSIGKTIDITKGKVDVQITLKMPNSQCNMMLWGDDGNGNTGAINAHAGVSTWGIKDTPRFPGEYGNSEGVKFRDGNAEIGIENSRTKYYTYRWIIDDAGKTIYFYSKGVNSTDWSTPKIDSFIYEDTDFTNLNSIRFQVVKNKKDNTNSNSSGELLEWGIKDIKITQIEEPVVTESTFADGSTVTAGEAADVSHDISSVSFGFNTSFIKSDATKENIKVYVVDKDHVDENGNYIEIPYTGDYTIDVNAQGTSIDVDFADELGCDKDYKIVVDGLKADTVEQGEMSAATVLNISTARKFEFKDTPTVSTTTNITVNGNLRTYEEVSGDEYVVVAALIKNDGSFVKVLNNIGTANGADKFNNQPYNFDFGAISGIEGFNANEYKIRFFVLDGIEGSVSNCKTIDVPLVPQV